MEEIAKQLTEKWKSIIENLSVDGYTREISSAHFHRMHRSYFGYPEIEWCYKVVYNFADGFGSGDNDKVDRRLLLPQSTKDKWNDKLDKTFIDLWLDGQYAVPGNNEEFLFRNSKVDYITNQGYRFIIQFYPAGFLEDMREEKINEIGI